MAILKPEDFINKHVNVPAVLTGHGPSLENDIEEIQELQEDGKLIRFSVNNWWHFFELPPTYYTLCNDYWSVERTRQIVEDSSDVINAVFYCDCLDPVDPDYIRDNCSVDYVPYDQRHHSGVSCVPYDPSCCPHVKLRYSIQEIVAKKVGHDEMRTLFVSSVYMSYYLAVIMGCNPIYFAGVDLSWGAEGYAKNLVGQKWAPQAAPGPFNNRSKQGCSNAEADLANADPSYDSIVLDTTQHVMDIAKAANVQVYNLNPDAWYGIIPHAKLTV